jgi:HEAT repeat protein
LGHLQVQSAVQPLMAILGNKQEKSEVRVGAAYALGEIGHASAVSALATVIADHPAPAPKAPEKPAAGAPPPPPAPKDETIAVRTAAARALGRLDPKYAITPLATSVTPAEPNAEVRVAAAYSLGDLAGAAEDELSSDAAVDALMAGLSDEIGDVRIACAYGLGKSSPSESRKSLVQSAIEKAREDKHYWARLAAQDTTRMLRLPE